MSLPSPHPPDPLHRQQWLEIQRQERAERLRKRVFSARAHFERDVARLRADGRRVVVVRGPDPEPAGDLITARLQVDGRAQRWLYASGTWEAQET